MNTTPLNKLLVIDIETVPQYPDYHMLSTDWQNRWWHKVAKIVPESDITPEESYKQKAGIMAEFGKIVCISIGCFHEKGGEWLFRIKSVYNDNEKQLLLDFLELSNKFCARIPDFNFAGHNIREFDIPFICRRMLINGVALPQYLCLHNAKPWEVKMMDTLQWWKFGDYKNFISLDLLAGVMGVPTSKTDIDGSMVQEVYYKEKDLLRIVEYCQRDVEVVANLLLKFNNLPLLQPEHVTVVQEAFSAVKV